MSHVKKAALPAMTLAALGVVFGDIGTSPLYAIKECFSAAHIDVTIESIMGILSLIFWCMTITISIKYVSIIMRADNNGEGGIMSLLALNLRNKQLITKHKLAIIACGFVGASLFFGDGIITPAISVLSAVEGLSIATPIFNDWIVPIALGILTALFMIQRHGTAVMGKFFGPVTLLWFLSLGTLGLWNIIQTPIVLGMVSPHWAASFVWDHPAIAFFTMGAVILTITGGEALYADLGHFEPTPIRMAWFTVVLPCLLLNYAGQGALLLRRPDAIENPFFLMVPEWALYPMIGLATIAAIIASQAMITGIFSMAKQAIQLGYLPRLTIQQTSESEQGQIYVPFLNWTLFIAVFIIVLLFENSSNLASAYGVAVTSTMLCGTILITILAHTYWRWPVYKTALVMTPFFVLDLIFVSATSLKIPAGGWVTIAIGGVVFVLLMTWKRGRELMFENLQRDALPLDIFINHLGNSVQIVPGQAIFMTSTPKIVPHAMLHNLKHNKILHELNFLITVETKDVPYVEDDARIYIKKLDERFIKVIVYYGFKDEPDIPKALKQVYDALELEFNMMQISFFISRDRVISTVGDGMAPWREKLFISMQRNTSAVSDFYQIPSNRVVELGSQIEI